MLYVIAYDISNDRRRAKVHKLLCGFGEWTQYSLFECFLNEKQVVLLRHRLETILDKQSDNVRMYPLCKGCQRNVETIGSKPPEEATLFLM